jgi:hypothetical protein
MTNIPNPIEIFYLLIVLTFIPFVTAFTMTYLSYKKLSFGTLGGIFGILFFLLIVFLLPDSSFLIRGLIAGGVGSIVLITILSRSYQLDLPDISALRHNRKAIVSIILIVGTLLSVSLYYSSEKADLEFSIDDPKDDLGYSGYSTFKLSNHDDIDIVKMQSQVIGDNVIIEMEVSGTISKNESVEYKIMIATSKHSSWTKYLSIDQMEIDGNTVRTRIPIETFDNRKIFHVIGITSEYDPSTDLNINDVCSNRGFLWDTFTLLIS